MKSKFLTLVLIFTSTILIAQKAEPPQNMYEVEGKIEFSMLTDAGTYLIGHGKGIMGINPGVSSPLFNFIDYGKVREEDVELIPLTPYIIINDPAKGKGPLQGISNKSKRAVIDLINGKTLFATEEYGWQSISEMKIFLPDNQLVVIGNRNKKEGDLLAGGIYDLETGNQIALVNLDPNSGKRTRSVANIPVSSGAPFLAGNRLFVPTTKNVICADISSGNILWESDVQNLNRMEADESGNEIYGFEEKGGNTRIYKFSSTGESLWSKERKIKGVVNRFHILPQGIAVVSDIEQKQSGSGIVGKAVSAASKAESVIAFLNAADGSDLWEKAPKTKGYIQHFYIQNNGILFGVESGGINLIAFDGTPLFKKPLATGENIKTMAMTPQGMIYITNSDANIIDLSSGESIWKKPINYKKAEIVTDAYDKKNGRYLISTGKELISIDEKTGDVNTIANIKFEGKEIPDNLEVRNDGILLTSERNILLLDFNGKEKFQEFFKGPGKSTAGAILAGVSAVTAVAATFITARAAMANRQVNFAGTDMATVGDYTGTGEAYMRASRNFENIAAQSFKEMTKRFTATASTKDAQFVLTSLANGSGLTKVNKDSGQKEREILLEDKNPEYTVDELGGFLFYQATSKTIYAYDLKR